MGVPFLCYGMMKSAGCYFNHTKQPAPLAAHYGINIPPLTCSVCPVM
ncbi:hypothetical protein [Kingella kingae]|nr:hypothetical protein [Kingella kingae]